MELERKKRALKAILGVTVGGLGLGAAARGILGVNSMMNTSPPSVDESASLPAQIQIPILDKADYRRKQQQRLGMMPAGNASLMPAPKFASFAKLAETLKEADLGATINSGLDSLGGAVDSGITEVAKHMPSTGGHANPAASYWALPMVVGGGGLGLLQGWSMVNSLLKKRHSSELAAELQAARGDYQGEIRRGFQDRYDKEASSPYDGVESLYEAAKEKQAGAGDLSMDGGGLKDTANTGLGTLLAMYGLTALGPGMMTYNWVKGRRQQDILEAAKQQRAHLRRFEQRPIYAVTEPVKVDEFEAA